MSKQNEKVYQTNAKNKVQRICELAKNLTGRNEYELENLLTSVCVDLYDGPYTPVTLLAKEKSIEAALYLITKFNASQDFFMLGLGLGGHLDVAMEQIQLEKDKDIDDIRINFIRGLVRNGHIELIKDQLNLLSSDGLNRAHSQLMLELGIAGNVDAAKAQLRNYDTQQFLIQNPNFSLTRMVSFFIYGLGIGGHAEAAKDELSLFEGNPETVADLKISFVTGLGLGCHADAANEQINTSNKDQSFNLRKKFIYGLAQGGHFKEAFEQLRLAEELGLLTKSLQEWLVAGLGSGGHIDIVKTVLFSQKANSDGLGTLIRCFINGLDNENRTKNAMMALISMLNEIGINKTSIFQAFRTHCLNVQVSVSAATKIDEIKKVYQLDNFYQALALSKQSEGVRQWFLQEHIFDEKQYANGERVENNLPSLPIDVLRTISSLVLGLSRSATDKIIAGVNNKLFSDITGKNPYDYFKLSMFSAKPCDTKLNDMGERYHRRMHHKNTC